MTEFNFDQLLLKLKGPKHRVVVFAPHGYYNKVIQFCGDNHIEYLGIDQHVNKEALSIRLENDPNHWLLYERASYSNDDQSTLIESFGNDFTDLIIVYWESPNRLRQVMGRAVRRRSHNEKWQPRRLKNVYRIGLKVTTDN